MTTELPDQADAGENDAWAVRIAAAHRLDARRDAMLDALGAELPMSLAMIDRLDNDVRAHYPHGGKLLEMHLRTSRMLRSIVRARLRAQAHTIRDIARRHRWRAPARPRARARRRAPRRASRTMARTSSDDGRARPIGGTR